ncbi:MAG: serpin family protein [Vallitaleaceae bacterium]|nr:serpin family protein [Vallitaleaceae bacterium]
MKQLIALGGVLILLSGCGQIEQSTNTNIDINSDTTTPTNIEAVAVEPTTTFEVTRVNKESVTSADAGLFGSDKADDNYVLGMEVLRSLWLDDPDSNHLISPVSLSFALAMLQNGAQGDTKDQITALLGEEENLNEAYKNIMLYLTQDSGENQALAIANSYWMRDDMTPKQAFIDTLKASYDAEVYISDFTSTDTVDSMNQWVEEQTNGMLKDTIDQLDPDTLSILMNTIYFKGTWVDEFEANATSDQIFYVTEDITETVSMMHQTNSFNYYEDETCQTIVLPYIGGTEMVVILPKDTLNNYMLSVTDEVLGTLVVGDGFEYNSVRLSLPKFTFDAKNDLNDILKSLGMIDAFSKEVAEFGLMIEEAQPVWVSRIFQNTKIDLDEAGTEAAAVTVIEMKTESAMEMEEPLVMTCDQPFLFVIKDSVTDLPIFMGTYTGE